MKKIIYLVSGLIILTISSCGPKPGTPEAALKIRKDQIEKVEKKVELTEKEKKREIKMIQKQIKDGKKKGILTDDEIAELEDKLEGLKNED